MGAVGADQSSTVQPPTLGPGVESRFEITTEPCFVIGGAVERACASPSASETYPDFLNAPPFNESLSHPAVVPSWPPVYA